MENSKVNLSLDDIIKTKKEGRKKGPYKSGISKRTGIKKRFERRGERRFGRPKPNFPFRGERRTNRFKNREERKPRTLRPITVQLRVSA